MLLGQVMLLKHIETSRYRKLKRLLLPINVFFIGEKEQEVIFLNVNV